jgi:hypothetical protein
MLTQPKLGRPARPWLSIIMDDYRAVAGYFFTYKAPAVLDTPLALRQARIHQSAQKKQAVIFMIHISLS